MGDNGIQKPFKAEEEKLLLLECSSAHHKVVVGLSHALDECVCVLSLKQRECEALAQFEMSTLSASKPR